MIDNKITISKLEFIDKSAKASVRFAKELFGEDVKSALKFIRLFSVAMNEITCELFGEDREDKDNAQYN